jgi:hypothetical protein
MHEHAALEQSFK